MKKLGLLVMPLMAVAFLASCGGGGGQDPVVYHTLTFNGTHCEMHDAEGNPVQQKQFKAGQTASFHLVGNPAEEFKIPMKDDVKLTITGTEDPFDGIYSYNQTDGSLSVKMTADVTITAVSEEKPGPGPTPDKWYEDQVYLKGLTEDDVTKEGGEIQTLKVNGLDHQVRLIGVNKDKDANGNTIHTTWEFVNLISDKNGFSLATQWNDTNEIDTANHKYKESTIRNALNGEKVSNVRWAQKGQTTWSSDYKCSVLDMLNAENEGFGDALKAPSKYISIWNDEKQSEAGWDEETVNDKLFLLSPVEMGAERSKYEETKTTAYSYYEGATNAKRIKKQIKGTEICKPYCEISRDKGQTYQGTVLNFAGDNSEVDKTGGGSSWLRSPSTDYSNDAWRVNVGGYLYNYHVDSNALAVAPAFCI